MKPKESGELLPIDEKVLQDLMSGRKEFRRFLLKRLPSEAAADDLLSQGFMKAIENQDSLEDAESATAWFYTILRNALIDYYRAHASESKKYAKYLEELTIEGADRAPALDEVEGAVCACMNALLPTLKPEYAEVLGRVDLRGESLDGVAASLATNVNNITVRLHRARQALKASLERMCGICTEHGCLDCSCEE